MHKRKFMTVSYIMKFIRLLLLCGKIKVKCIQRKYK